MRCGWEAKVQWDDAQEFKEVDKSRPLPLDNDAGTDLISLFVA